MGILARTFLNGEVSVDGNELGGGRCIKSEAQIDKRHRECGSA